MQVSFFAPTVTILPPNRGLPALITIGSTSITAEAAENMLEMLQRSIAEVHRMNQQKELAAHRHLAAVSKIGG